MNKTERFINKANIIHKSIYDYVKTKYISVDKKVIITCKKHGDFEQTPRLHLYKKAGCNACAVERSVATNAKSTDQFITEATQIHGDKYDYSKVVYVNARTKVQIICPTHGAFLQEPASHTRGYGCKKCAVRDDIGTFIDKATTLHGNVYNYEKTHYTFSTEKVTITCPIHGDFEQQAQSHLQGRGCPTCGFERNAYTSIAEQEIADFIRSLGEVTITGSHSIIPPKELDIVVLDKNVAFEYNGIFWHSELGGKDKRYHLNKTVECKTKNIRLVHILETEYMRNKELVLSRIRNILGFSDKIHARKCNIVQITPKQSREFLQHNHIQGFHAAKCHYGLMYQDELVAVMTFGKSRFSKEYQWELVRYANKQNYSVVGGASRLFKHFIKQHDPVSMISYSDKRWNTGKLYEQLGFKYTHSSAPNYFYFHKSATCVLMSRQQFQKHKQRDKLEIFDPALTEWENMKNNGYNRVWDCGNDVFVWSKKAG